MLDRSKRGSDFINATTLNICKLTFDAVSILNVYEAALTYMISVNTNDVQLLLEVLDLNQVANFFLMRMQARPLCVKVGIKPVNLIVLACDKY